MPERVFAALPLPGCRMEQPCSWPPQAVQGGQRALWWHRALLTLSLLQEHFNALLQVRYSSNFMNFGGKKCIEREEDHDLFWDVLGVFCLSLFFVLAFDLAAKPLK